jgi:hypothetical protein
MKPFHRILNPGLLFLLCFAALPLFAAALLESPQKNKQAADEKGQQAETEKATSKELELRACGDKEINYKADTDKKQHPVPQPSAGKALVFVIRPTMMGNKIQTKLAMDGKWLGTNRGNNYYFFEADPGERCFCSKAENRSVLVLTLEAGKTYYLQQKVQMGLLKARNKLVALDDAEGTKGLAKCNLSVFEEKQK